MFYSILHKNKISLFILLKNATCYDIIKNINKKGTKK